ncbi:MAG TPA: hypothetical protein VK968_14000 [Roseimicrobium sp.]|nr:hypothetical protein [Roseimicrobium sp.]
MAERANVTSVEALDSFRAHLLVYLEKTTLAVDDALDDVQRTRRWLETDQRRLWEGELKKRRKLQEIAEQDLFSARLGNLKESTTLKHMAVVRAKRATVEAEEKLVKLKRWERQYDTDVIPLAKPLEKLRGVLVQEMRQAAHSLTQTVHTLEAYAERAPGGSSVREPDASAAAKPEETP